MINTNDKLKKEESIRQTLQTQANDTATQKKEKLWNINYNRTMIANFCMYFAFYLLTPLLPVYLSDNFHATKDVMGMVLFGYSIAALCIRPFSGFMVDSFNRKKVLLICLIINALFFAGYLIASSLLLFAIVRTLHGSPFGASTVANNTMAIDVLPSSRRSEGIGYYGLSNNIATAIAPTIGIFIYHWTHNFDHLFWIAFIVAVVGMLTVTGIETKPRKDAKPTAGWSLDRFFLTRGWLIGVNAGLFGFCYGVLSNYLAIYGKERLGIDAGTGTYFLLLSLGLILSRLQGSKSLREGKMTRNAAEGILISTIGYTLFIALPNQVGYYGSALLIGLGNGHLWPAFTNMIIGVAPHTRRGTAISTILTLWDLGMGMGILLGGVIAEHFDYTMAFTSTAIVHGLALLLYLVCTKKFYLKRIHPREKKAE